MGCLRPPITTTSAKQKNWGLIRPIHHAIKWTKTITKITTQKFTIKAVHVHVKNQTV